MKCMTQAIINHVNKNGKVTVKLDQKSGYSQLMITKRANDYIIGEHPGGRLVRAYQSKVVQAIDEVAMFITKWF